LRSRLLPFRGACGEPVQLQRLAPRAASCPAPAPMDGRLATPFHKAKNTFLQGVLCLSSLGSRLHFSWSGSWSKRMTSAAGPPALVAPDQGASTFLLVQLQRLGARVISQPVKKVKEQPSGRPVLCLSPLTKALQLSYLS